MKNSLLILLLSHVVYCQSQDTLKTTGNNVSKREKVIFSEYSGGRFGYSGERLKLYTDSTYQYSSWLHTGHSSKDVGTYIIKDSTITLCSMGYDKAKKKRKQSPYYRFENVTYRMHKDKILLYSEKEEKGDKDKFYQTYFTLYKDE